MSSATEKEHHVSPKETNNDLDVAERMRSEQKGVKREREEVASTPDGDDPKKLREDGTCASLHGSEPAATAAGGFKATLVNPWALPAGTSGFGSGAAASGFGASAWSASASTASPWSVPLPLAGTAAAGQAPLAGAATDSGPTAGPDSSKLHDSCAAAASSGWLSSAWSAPAVSVSGSLSGPAPSFAPPTAGLGTATGGAGGWAAAMAAADSVEPLGAGAAVAGGEEEGEEEEEGEGDADAEAHNAALLAAEGGGSASLLESSSAKPLPTGEEQEVTILQLRGKLFVLEKSSGSDAKGAGAGTGTEHHGGDEGHHHGGRPEGKGLGSTGLGTALASKVGASSASPSSGSSAPIGRWRECGTGPLRLNVRLDMAQLAFPRTKLPQGAKASSKAAEGSATEGKSSSGPVARFIMRQETGAGATHSASGRVLLNAPLHAGFICSVHPQNNRAVQFTAPEVMAEGSDADNGSSGSSGSSATRVVLRSYLLRLPGPDSALDLVEAVQEMKQNLGTMEGEGKRTEKTE